MKEVLCRTLTRFTPTFSLRKRNMGELDREFNMAGVHGKGKKENQGHKERSSTERPKKEIIKILNIAKNLCDQ